MKLKIEEILDKIEELYDDINLTTFISSLDLTPEQMDILVKHENEYVRWGLAQNPKITEKIMIQLTNDENTWVRFGLAENPNLTEKVIIKLSSDEKETVKNEAFKKLRNLDSLKKEELEKAYDLIRRSKYIGRENFEKTFDYIADKFLELNKLAKIYRIILLHSH